MDGACGPNAAAGAENRPRPCLLVLGMHRSGTSALARGLAVLGADLGDELLPEHPCNPRGFFEDRDIYACNKALLGALGLAWADAAPVEPRRLVALAAGETGAQALELVRRKIAGRPLPAFKDPRMSRLLPFWRPVLAAAGLMPACLLALRHPDAVAQSLARRDGMAAETAHALWLCHTLDARDGSRGLPRLLVSYERLLAAPGRELARIGHALGLRVDAEALAVFAGEFLDAALCHHGAPAAAGGGEEPRGLCARLSPRLHAALEELAAALPETLEQGLARARLARLRGQAREALAGARLP